MQKIAIMAAEDGSTGIGVAQSLAVGPNHSLRVAMMAYPGQSGAYYAVDGNADNVDFSGTFPSAYLLGTASANLLYDGGAGTWDRRRGTSATNLALASKTGTALYEHSGHWSQSHEPAANTLATTSKAAGGAGVRHICTGFSYSLVGVAAIAAPIYFRVRDGAAGAGTILWSVGLTVPIGNTVHFNLSGLSLLGSANTAMTAEFSAAPGATNFESVSLTGFTVA